MGVDPTLFFFSFGGRGRGVGGGVCVRLMVEWFELAGSTVKLAGPGSRCGSGV